MTDKLERLAEIKRRADGCTACILHEKRKHAVVFRGSASASRIFVLGESPGAEEDRIGEPFRGPAGQLLDYLFATAGISTSTDVFMTNASLHHPPGNRKATSVELQACQPFWTELLGLVQPRIVVLCGGVAYQAWTGKAAKDVKVGALRGEWWRARAVESEGFGGVDIDAWVTVIWHPAYLLRLPPGGHTKPDNGWRQSWEDFQEIGCRWRALVG